MDKDPNQLELDLRMPVKKSNFEQYSVSFLRQHGFYYSNTTNTTSVSPGIYSWNSWGT